MTSEVRYLDTRALSHHRPTFSQAVIEGIAPGGGLFVPERLPSFTLEDILRFEQCSYPERAATVLEAFGIDIAPGRIRDLVCAAYGAQWDDPRIAPVEEVVAGIHVLELWHGPTSAFKDLALQCMPLLFSESIAMQRATGALDEDFLILVATSGDTGKAALEGFADRPHTAIVVFYPADGVSDIQRKQMVTQRGANVAVFGVRGNFDDCQSAVKQAFGDEGFTETLRRSWHLRLSSANSINWGRLLPQVVYYVSAYADMVAAGGVKPGHPVDVCVPTGNFGNILGAYYAKRIGVPIGRLICASNENNVLSDFIATGVYDIRDRRFVQTPSPSMDILISSNLERLLYHLAGPEAVRRWMAELASEGRFHVDHETFHAVRELLVGDFVTNDESLATIRRVHEESGYLLDPHTAVAWEVAERTRAENPVLVVSTAHWAKFGKDVAKALLGVAYRDELPEPYRGCSETELLRAVAELAPRAAAIPRNLAELDGLPERFTGVVEAGREPIESAITDWLASRAATA